MDRVDELMKVAFETSRRTWRSYEYKKGVRAVLEFRFSRAALPELPDRPGTTASDAYLAGMEEGWMLLLRFEQASAFKVTSAECHFWLQEQRAHVMDNLAYISGSRPTREMALPRSLVVMEAIQRRLPGMVLRYSWEADAVSAQGEPAAGGDQESPNPAPDATPSPSSQRLDLRVNAQVAWRLDYGK